MVSKKEQKKNTGAKERIIPVKKVEWFKNERKTTPSIADALLQDKIKKSQRKKITLAFFLLIIFCGAAWYIFFIGISFPSHEYPKEKRETIPGDSTLPPQPPPPLLMSPAIEKKEEKTPSPVTVVIASTPTGWLNVRAGPGISYTKIVRIHPEEEYVLLEESGGWYKIQIDASKTGWITSQYAKKK